MMQLLTTTPSKASPVRRQERFDRHGESSTRPLQSPACSSDTPSLAKSPGSSASSGESPDRERNPQDATIPILPLTSLSTEKETCNTNTKQTEFTRETAVESIGNNSSSKPKSKLHQPINKKKKKQAKPRKRKRGRTVRLATVDEGEANELPSLPLPLNQYETILRRRAIRTDMPEQQQQQQQLQQLQPQQTNNQQQSNNSQEDEIYGDISLGMKISFHAGKAVVRHLNNLSDGRASPAQLAGVIRPGDVLLSINGNSLVNLPFDKLMGGLSPLSTPDADGNYQRYVGLRFAVGEEGLLDKVIEEENMRMVITEGHDQLGLDGTTDLFSLALLPFDIQNRQLQMQEVEEQKNHQLQEDKQEQHTVEERPHSLETSHKSKLEQINQIKQICNRNDCNDNISQTLAQVRQRDRDIFVSQFFTWNQHSLLLRPFVAETTATEEVAETFLTRSEMLELGRRAILGAMSLGSKIEEFDQGVDVRSFQSWNSSLSLRSGAGSRRRYVMEVASLPGRFWKNSDESSSTATGDSGDSLDGDELLLRLAAHDQIWRKQVIKSLRKAITDLQNFEEPEPASQPVAPDMDAALSNELGNFLFGETVSKIVTEKKKSKALPPEEITSVLFDLSTHLAFTMPEEVTVAGASVAASLRSTLLPFRGRRQKNVRCELLLATHFLLEEALPLWLKSFLPLQWEQRRVLWPPIGAYTPDMGSTQKHWDDSLTIDSFTTLNTPNRANTKRKNLREIIEDQELNVETRGETCFLVSYYFERYLVPKLVDRARAKGREELLEFVKEYGSYIKMDTCLAYSAMMECEDAISVLLEVAEHDPRHHESMKQLTNVDKLVIYDSTMLSAVVKCLHNIRRDRNADRRLKVIHACVSAYPDVRPWQVRKECLLECANVESNKFNRCSKEELWELYYSYLSLLLHPSDGHEAARRDGRLVEEWCVLSLQQCNFGARKEAQSRRKNFYCVASRCSSDHLVYHRDLVTLLKLSMSSVEFDIALDLVSEILDHEYSLKEEVYTLLVKSLRTIAHSAMNEDWELEKNTIMQTLKRIISLFGKMTTKFEPRPRQSISIGDELHSLLCHKSSGKADSTVTDPQTWELILFLARQAVPGDVLQTLNHWTESHELRSQSISLLQTVLQRGAQVAMKSEISGSLFHLKRARQNFSSKTSSLESLDGSRGVSDDTIWGKMSNGLLTIEK